MPYRLAWLLENRVMLIGYEGVVTSADLQAYLDESLALRDRANAVLGAGGPLVHTITDARRATKMEVTMKDGQNIIKTLRKQRVGWSVYIARSAFDQFFAGIGHQMAGVRYRSLNSVTEAVEFLKSVDDTLATFDYMPSEDTASRSPFKR